MTTTPVTDDAAERGFTEPGTFGRHLLIDMAGCDAAFVRNADAVAEWAAHLVDEIGMDPFGEPIVLRFGKGSLFGNSVFQPITTSHIAVHANDDALTAFADVYSCTEFNVDAAVAFTVRAFGARAHTVQNVLRVAPTLDA